jgi:hydroxylamine reductase (hybrid-cluster protein)
MKLNYEQIGDYLLPNLKLNNEKTDERINRFGLLRLEYLKQNNKALYTTMLMKNELTNNLISVSNKADNMYNNMINFYKRNDEKLSEKSKENNQLEWVKLMNNYKNSIEEFILKELINL